MIVLLHSKELPEGANLETIIKMIAAGFGTGYSPTAPGSVGTLVGIPIYLMLSHLSWPFHLLGIMIIIAIAVYTAGVAEGLGNYSHKNKSIFAGSVQKGSDASSAQSYLKDPGWIVIDEIAGLQVTLFLISPTLWHIVAGYLLFRFFDIFKIFPANLCETRLSGGYAIAMDDVVAGIYANIVLWALIRFAGIF